MLSMHACLAGTACQPSMQLLHWQPWQALLVGVIGTLRLCAALPSLVQPGLQAPGADDTMHTCTLQNSQTSLAWSC